MGEAVARRRVVEMLRVLAERLRVYGLRSLVLTGSYARGEQLRDSDIDAIIVAEAFEGLPFYEREYLVLREWSYPDPLEPWCYTSREVLEHVFRRPRIDLIDALEYGIVVYDDGFWRSVRETYAQRPYRRRAIDGAHYALELEPQTRETSSP